MPCIDAPSREEVRQSKLPEAVLCAICRVLEGNAEVSKLLLDAINWEDAGVTRADFGEWWVQHSAADNFRRSREAALKAREEFRKTALAKLTQSERAALGLDE